MRPRSIIRCMASSMNPSPPSTTTASAWSIGAQSAQSAREATAGECFARDGGMERTDLELERRTRKDRRGTLALAGGLVDALERDEIEVLFQPQFGAIDGAIVGAEALARWRHPEQVLIGGEALFEAAESA